jgi:hypothetical protein
MKKQPSKNRILISAGTLFWVLSLPLLAFAVGDNPSTTVPHDLTTSIKDSSNKRLIVKEAVDAAKATQTALKALFNDQPKEAIAALQVASGNLHLLLARDPALGLVPIDIQVQILAGASNLKTIKRLEDELNDLIDDKKYQEARPIIESLADEIRISEIFLPLATYPSAIDQVMSQINAGKLSDAKQTLISTIDTLIYEQEITPLSIIRAEDKLSEAFQIQRKEDLSKQVTKDKISHLVIDAHQEIKVAEALGYGVKTDYELLYDSMETLKKSIGTAGFEGEWIEIKKSLSSFKNKIVHPHGDV